MATNKLEKKYALTILLVTMIGFMILLGLQVFQLNTSATRLKAESQQSFADESETQLRQRGEDLAEYLAHDVSSPYLAFDMLALFDLIVPVSQSTGVRSVFLYGPDGAIAHDGTREILQYGTNIRQLYPGLQPEQQTNQTLRTGNSIAIVRPVMAENTHLGSVIIELSTANTSASLTAGKERMDAISNTLMSASLWQLILASLTMVVAAALFAVFAGRRLAQPIKHLAEQAERIGSGDYHTAIRLDRDDEVGDLAAAFERMRVNLRQQTERTEYHAFFDQLTGLRNRTSFNEVMNQTFANSAPSTKHVMLYLDIDGFKRVNDGLGHSAGDRLLKKVAQRLRRWATQYAVGAEQETRYELARWGGDQFVVLLKDVSNIESVAEQARQLLRELAVPQSIAGIEMVISASIGYAVFPDDARDSENLISYADLAMYRSKERGPNYVSAYLPHVHARTHTSLLLESEIRGALVALQFEPLYYPVIDTTSSAVTGLEVKVVWNHPDRGPLDPRDFMAAMSTGGLLPQFREWIYNAGLDSLRTWQNTGFRNLQMTFNLANVDFDPEWLRDIVADGLERTEIDSRDVLFQISESSFSKNIVRSAESLQDLRKFGINVWINNFGIGYSAINRLRRVPLAGIKLHPSVVADLNTSKDSQNMVSASVAMAHGFGILAGADGVNDEQQLAFLRRKGCDIVQGEIASAPLKAADVGAYLARSYAGPRLIRTSLES